MKNYIKNILKWLICLFLVAITASCGTVHRVVTEYRYETVKKDSVIFNIRDSVVTIPVEKVINVTLPGQVSELETSLAKSKAYTDTLGFLHHNMENKKGFSQHIHNEEKQQVKIDSVYVKVPEPYEVVVKEPFIPKFYKFTLWWFIGTVLLLAVLIYLKISKRW